MAMSPSPSTPPARSTSVARRTFLVGASSAAGLLAAGTLTGPQASAVTPFETVLAKRREYLTGGTAAAKHPQLAAKRATFDAKAKNLADSFVTTSGRAGLWSDLEVGDATTTDQVDHMGVSANQVTTMALAWASPASALHHDQGLLSKIHDALEFLSKPYRADRERPGNWWFWQIGLPRQVAETLVLLADQQPDKAVVDSLLAAIRFHAPDPNVRTGSTEKETGANRVDKALACVLRGLLSQNEAEITLGAEALSDVKGKGEHSVFALTTTGDGFYTDGSFIQHGKLPYSGTYGGVALKGVGEVLSMLKGSPWAVDVPELTNLLDAVEKAFAPFQWDVRAMDTTRGRAVSRDRERDADSGFVIASSILVLADAAPAERRSWFRALVKGWLQRTTDRTVATNAQSLADSARSLALVADGQVQAAEAREGTTNTYVQERVVHHRGTWAAVVSTSSARIGRYEWGNKENTVGWYQGDGMFYLYHRGDSGQFSDDFWPTVDPYALPGVTLNGEHRDPLNKTSFGTPPAKNTYAGGLSLDGVVGTTAMDLTNATGTLTANKSWFYLTDSVVCLGTKITDSSGTPVRTILENRSFPDAGLPRVTAAARPTSVHIDGHAGFVALPVPGHPARTLQVSNERRTGTWRAINDGGDNHGSDDPVTRRYVRVVQQHQGANDWYAYQVLPLASAERTAAAAKRPDVRVLVAEPEAHVVSGPDQTMGHLFAAGTHGGHRSTGPCAFGYRTSQGADVEHTEVVVSQPTKQGGSVQVDFPFAAPGAIVHQDRTVTVVSKKPLKLRVDVEADRGSEHRIAFERPLPKTPRPSQPTPSQPTPTDPHRPLPNTGA